MIDEDRSKWTLEELAAEVIEACELPMGCRGTIISALHDAKEQGKAASVAYAEGLKALVRDALPIVQAYAAANLPHQDLDGNVQDPNGAHYWLHHHAALQSPPSQGGECAGLAPPAGCRWPKTCGAQLAEAAVREEGEGRFKVVIDPTVPADTVIVKDAATGKELGRIVNLEGA